VKQKEILGRAMLQTCSVDIFIHYAGLSMKFPASAERIPVPLGSDTTFDVKKKGADKILICTQTFPPSFKFC